MPEKAADELRTRNHKDLLDSGFIITSLERFHISVNRENSGIGDSDLMGIAPKIFNGIAFTIEGLLDEAVPIHIVELVAEELPLNRVLKG